MNNHIPKAKLRQSSIFIFVLLSACVMWGCSFSSLETKVAPTPAGKINYCMNDSSVLCIVSFGVDNQNNMVINLTAPDSNFQLFYIDINDGGQITKYECQKVAGFPKSVYCVGPRVNLGDAVDISAYSQSGNTLIAQGTFIINALALPTAAIVRATPTFTSSPVTATITKTLTPTPTFGLTSTPGTRTATPDVTPTRTPTLESYSYP